MHSNNEKLVRKKWDEDKCTKVRYPSHTKEKGKIGRIENVLTIQEVESLKYLRIQINQSIRTETHHK